MNRKDKKLGIGLKVMLICTQFSAKIQKKNDMVTVFKEKNLQCLF